MCLIKSLIFGHFCIWLKIVFCLLSSTPSWSSQRVVFQHLGRLWVDSNGMTVAGEVWTDLDQRSQLAIVWSDLAAFFPIVSHDVWLAVHQIYVDSISWRHRIFRKHTTYLHPTITLKMKIIFSLFFQFHFLVASPLVILYFISSHCLRLFYTHMHA